jgi:hypothetical protein
VCNVKKCNGHRFKAGVFFLCSPGVDAVPVDRYGIGRKTVGGIQVNPVTIMFETKVLPTARTAGIKLVNVKQWLVAVTVSADHIRSDRKA